MTKKPKPVVLIILDGWGIAPPSGGNGVSLAKTPVMDQLIATYPTMTLQASGEAVGLSWGEMGNSEVGHLNLGSGKVIYQSLPRINKEISEGNFFKNEVLLKAVKHVGKNKSKLHLLGLISNGGVHSHQDHLYALLELCKQNKINEVYIHAILDGRDTKKDAALDFIKQLQAKIQEIGVGKIASLHGRYYAMDRNNHWDRIEKSYTVMTTRQAESAASDPLKAIEDSYSKNVFDEEFIPTAMPDGAKIEEKDAVIFFNYRADRARQMTAAFTLPGFEKFSRLQYLKGLFFATMMEYSKDLPVEVAFPPEPIQSPLSKIIQDKGLAQLHIAETEKYAHVTFFFNGGKEDEFKKEERILVPSPSVATYDKKPEMSAAEVTEKLIEALKTGKHDFVVLNYANADMVGHTGLVDPTIKSVESVDSNLGKLLKTILSVGGVAVITADHGNAEELLNLQTGEIDKEHSTNPVPLIIVGSEYKGKSSEFGTDAIGRDLSIIQTTGLLSDVAPTILRIMGISQPKDMTGKPLI
ncbi:2,3-bisphosphoglycerate-independent phosphoglycerate mutase [Patescibacteria group bacterium]|nr:2,3-bisphosphoglycerate-independent phosphoglycerate mutase [Patescibacteria group bacterium]